MQELDLDDNLIGDLGGREILEALMDRKEGYWEKICFTLIFSMKQEIPGYKDAKNL